ncbi:peptidase M23 [Actinorhabdospora filicis]|uniref:Peptidase M23 n=1 Tax=Actinorhabdospora filicis TaxID=1785913 RepID=A0A9W6SJ64_9ACTN|nr:M23 family metallopeptidase [Actinorhabdospora filicis]GLZ77238.1 peptidase M23 [Actinorhabdospora filicis]
MTLRNRLAKVAVAVVFGAVLAVPAAASAQADASTLAAPNHKLPFPCGQVWSGQTRSNHSPANAIDFNRANDEGDVVAASAPGTVTTVRDLGGTSYGRYVVIDHGGGYSSLYAHLQSWTVSVGDRVDYGTRIGYVGTTGGSTGPHLHYEQRTNGSSVRISFQGSAALYWGTRDYTSGNECGGNLYSPQDLCGAGYNKIDEAGLVSGGVSYGKVYLLYNASSKYNCVVTLKHRSLDTATATSSYLEPDGASRVTDSGNFGWYAGPVRAYAPGCVKWGGSVSGVAYNSPSEHCA